MRKRTTDIIDQSRNSVENDFPLILGNQLPTGQGKPFYRFYSKIFIEKQKKKKNQNLINVRLFSRSNDLVNMDVDPSLLEMMFIFDEKFID